MGIKDNTGLIAILSMSLMIGYVWELFPESGSHGFLFSEVELPARWYVFLLAKDIRTALLAWCIYILVPKNEKIISIGSLTICVFMTLIPINYMLFYSSPFSALGFSIKLIISLAMVLAINYRDGLLDKFNNINNSDNV